MTATSTTTVPDVIERELFIAAGIERVWSLVSKVGFWVGDDLRFDHEADEGETVVIHTTQYGSFPVEVTRLDAPRYAAYRWASSAPGAELTADNATLVEFTLKEREGGVLVQLRESGFASLPDGAAAGAVRDNEHGWTQQLTRLQAAATATGSAAAASIG